VRGPWIIAATSRARAATRWQDGWFPTGDVASIDADGYMQITDRSKDVIKSGGEWIGSIDLENIAMAHPAVAMAACIAVPHPKWDERPLLVVMKKPGAEVTRADMLAFFDGKIAKWWTPDDAAARPGQPPRPDHRRHRHRQDHHAADAGRELQQDRRAGVHGRREGRPDRHHAGRQHQPQAGRHPEGARPADTPESLACPATLWDVFGEQGHPVRATVSDMGPLLLARMLALNETQAGVLNLVFKIADDNGLLLLDMKDLRAMLQYVGDNASQFTTEYGNISAASVGAIQRGLLQIEEQGGDKFFGEPMLDISDFMQTSTARA
jgi:hypothetical protein